MFVDVIGLCVFARVCVCLCSCVCVCVIGVCAVQDVHAEAFKTLVTHFLYKAMYCILMHVLQLQKL